MDIDITPALLQKYFEQNRLGEVDIQIPGCGKISLDLHSLFQHATGIQFYEYATQPENIEAICVYGSVLYKHFPPHTETITTRKKKYILFGPIEIVTTETTEKPRAMPNDFDVMVITKESLTKGKPHDAKIIIPQRKSNEGYGNYLETIVDAAVKTKIKKQDFYGYVEVHGGSNLHITYRSVEQFLSGLGKGDTLSESVVRYGLPIINRERFAEIIRDVQQPKREPLHMIQWYETSTGKLQGFI